ncbi:hypothetical protein [Ralstonia phage phiRSL1]|uniref:Uncharacterized protein n=1 Tax=Ralstonia phage phiRSL1 TaxID=1980924 RepID=B2ZXU1_9CAUD|nr:hypothetical protein RSL1_ORF071 [Ralstonia phage phiRSL1]BAG41517.1 hypothetical protein [Ralstonia phage phiRSL1]
MRNRGLRSPLSIGASFMNNITATDLFLGCGGFAALLLLLYVISSTIAECHLDRFLTAYNSRLRALYSVGFYKNRSVFRIEGSQVLIETASPLKMFFIVRRLYSGQLSRHALEMLSDTPFSKLPS